MFKSTKRFTGFSCAHRQPAHDGHCKFLHGYSRSFYFVFAADEVDEISVDIVIGKFFVLVHPRKGLGAMFHRLPVIADDLVACLRDRVLARPHDDDGIGIHGGDVVAHLLDPGQVGGVDEQRMRGFGHAFGDLPGFLAGRREAVVDSYDGIRGDARDLRVVALGRRADSAEVQKDKWQVTQRALLWWLADEIKRQVRDEASLETWLESQELTGVLTQNEKQDMMQVLGKLGDFLGHGATMMIEAFAKGVGEGLGESTVRMGL